MKITRQEIKDLIKGIVDEQQPTSVSPDVLVDEITGNAFVDFVDASEHPHDKSKAPPIEYAVKVVLDHNHDGDQIKAEALIWDESLDMAEVNHIKTELERIVEKFISDKNRSGRRIR